MRAPKGRRKTCTLLLLVISIGPKVKSPPKTALFPHVSTQVNSCDGKGRVTTRAEDESVMCTALVAYRVEEDGEEELSSSDALVQLLGASWVFVVEDGMGEQPTGLPGQHLNSNTGCWLFRANVVLLAFLQTGDIVAL